MPGIDVVSLTKQFAGPHKSTVTALDNVTFSVGDGEMVVLVGPSGCGKTTTIRSIAGLEDPTSGRISLGDRVVYDRGSKTNVPIERRDVGVVFQNYALWPHMTARQNIEFPLRTKRVHRDERRRRVEEAAEGVQLAPALLDKIPAHLSGGQQQRVALSRALVGGSGVVLFDEPLSNLDAALREFLRIELKDMHDRLGFTGIYVTHDLTEAMVLGDRVVVMSEGQVEQFSKPSDVFENPVSITVARLVGMRPLVEFVAAPQGTVSAKGGDVEAPDRVLSTARAGQSIWAQPDRVEIVEHGDTRAADEIAFRGIVRQRSYLGAGQQLIVELATGRLPLVVRGTTDRWSVGDEVEMRVRADAVRTFSTTAAELAIDQPASEPALV